LEGVFTGTNKEVTIGILVARSKKKFTDEAKNRAKVARSNGYNIILTDEHDLYSDLINFIESHPLDGSNNITLRIELQLVEVLKELRQLREEFAEVRQETQQLRVELERSRSEDRQK